MSIIKEFAQKIGTESGSFVIDGKEDAGFRERLYFMQMQEGTARYVYGFAGLVSEWHHVNIRTKACLTAIVSNGMIYVLEEFLLNTFKEPTLPEGVKRFDDELREKKQYVSDVLFPAFYDTLETKDLNMSDICFCRQKAREILLSGDPDAISKWIPRNIENLFDERDLADILCGYMDFHEEANKRMRRDIDQYISFKTKKEKVKELMKEPGTVFEWEKRLASGLTSMNAKTVVVEFEVNGLKASGKIEPWKVLNILRNKDFFEDWSFVSHKTGELLRNSLHNNLDCHDIRKITYGKKVLYQKQ